MLAQIPMADYGTRFRSAGQPTHSRFPDINVQIFNKVCSKREEMASWSRKSFAVSQSWLLPFISCVIWAKFLNLNLLNPLIR